MTRGIYSSFVTPRFIWRQLVSVRSFEDVRYLVRGGLRVLGHLADFNFFGLGQKQTREMRRALKGKVELDEPVSDAPAPEPRGRVARPLPKSVREREAA